MKETKMLTVRELIEALKDVDPDVEVRIYDDEMGTRYGARPEPVQDVEERDGLVVLEA